ncbi:MAG: hypothetical protein LBE36_09255 [Flavobacteriaceae bacterium]|jgi:hypothetical protein|nr:hypothetical protein [Flavobacteriaceae bacterium]
MRKLLTITAIFSANFIFGQNCDEIIKENEYLKEVINVNKPQYQTNFDKTDFSITKIEGNIQQQTVTISILVNNKDVNKYIGLKHFSGIDLEGEQYHREDYADFGSKSISGTFNTDVPTKIEPILIKVPPQTQYMKLLKFEYSTDASKNRGTIEFRDLKIVWK